MASPLIELQERAAMGDIEAQRAIQRFNGQAPPSAPMTPYAPTQPASAPMTQSQFSNSKPVPPDVAARRQQQLIQLLRKRGEMP